MDLPTKTFKEYIDVEMDEPNQDKYLQNSMTFIFNVEKQIMVISEYLAVFETTSGDVLDDVIISGWNQNSGFMGEALMKRVREQLHFIFLDENNVIIYR